MAEEQIETGIKIVLGQPAFWTNFIAYVFTTYLIFLGAINGVMCIRLSFDYTCKPFHSNA